MSDMSRVNQALGYTQAVLSCVTGGVLVVTANGILGGGCIWLGLGLAVAEGIGGSLDSAKRLLRLPRDICEVYEHLRPEGSLSRHVCIGVACACLGLFSACLPFCLAKKMASFLTGCGFAIRLLRWEPHGIAKIVVGAVFVPIVAHLRSLAFDEGARCSLS